MPEHKEKEKKKEEVIFNFDSFRHVQIKNPKYDPKKNDDPEARDTYIKPEKITNRHLKSFQEAARNCDLLKSDPDNEGRNHESTLKATEEALKKINKWAKENYGVTLFEGKVSKANLDIEKITLFANSHQYELQLFANGRTNAPTPYKLAKAGDSFGEKLKDGAKKVVSAITFPFRKAKDLLTQNDPSEQQPPDGLRITAAPQGPQPVSGFYTELQTPRPIGPEEARRLIESYVNVPLNSGDVDVIAPLARNTKEKTSSQIVGNG